jgi:signal peptidase I
MEIMRIIIKYSNHFGFVVALCAMVISGCSCNTSKPTPDPLAGWNIDFSQPGPGDIIIAKDYKDYIQKEKLQQYTPMVFFYENEIGQHAVEIKFGLNKVNWHHVLIYDKDNKRIKTLKYISGYSQS